MTTTMDIYMFRHMFMLHISLGHTHCYRTPIYWTLNEHVSAWLWTPLLHVSVLSLYGQPSTLNTVFHVNICYSRYCCSMYIYQCYIDTNSLDTIIPVHEPLIYGYTISLDTVIRILCTLLFLQHSYIDLLVYMRLIVSIFLLHGSLLLLSGLLIFEYSCYIIYLFL